MNQSQSDSWRKQSKAFARSLGLKGCDLEDAESIGWTAAWKASQKEGVRDMDAFVVTAIRNAIRNYHRDTSKARSEVTNHDWED